MTTKGESLIIAQQIHRALSIPYSWLIIMRNGPNTPGSFSPPEHPNNTTIWESEPEPEFWTLTLKTMETRNQKF